MTVPVWEQSVYDAHCVHIEAGVFDEGCPLVGMCVTISPPKLHVFWPRLREQVYQFFTCFVFSFILRHAQNVTQRTQRAGQTMRQRDDHSVFDLLHWGVHVLVTQHRPVEGAVMDHDLVRRVDHHLDAVQRAALGQVHDLDRLIVKRIRHQQHFGVLRILVRAVRNWRFAEGLEIEPKDRH